MSMEERQRHTDAERGRFEVRELARQRFTTPFARDLFAMGVENMEAFRPAPALSKDDEARNRRAAEADEVRSEGRQHGNTRPQRHE